MESDREQAHLPAEQPPSCQDSRLPVAHAHPRRSRHRLGSPAQGPPRAVGLIRPTRRVPRRASSANRLRRSPRLRIGAALRCRAPAVVLSSCTSRVTSVPPDPAVGLVVGKTVGGSVVRHRVSRQLRHAMAARIQRLPRGQRHRGASAPGCRECVVGDQVWPRSRRRLGPVSWNPDDSAARADPRGCWRSSASTSARSARRFRPAADTPRPAARMPLEAIERFGLARGRLAGVCVGCCAVIRSTPAGTTPFRRPAERVASRTSIASAAAAGRPRSS